MTPENEPSGTGRAAMSKAWRQAAVLVLLAALSYAGLVALSHPERLVITNEDGVVELLGALGFVLTAGLMLLGFSRARRAGESRVKQSIYVTMSIVFLFAAGEELSWGQHLLGWRTPEALVEANRQDETNIHNLEVLGELDEYRLFTLLWFPFVLLVPLLASVSSAARRFLTRYIPLVSWPLGLVFVVNDVLSAAVGRLFAEGTAEVGPLYDVTRVELREGLFALLCAFVAYTLAQSAALRTDEPRAVAASRA